LTVSFLGFLPMVLVITYPSSVYPPDYKSEQANSLRELVAPALDLSLEALMEIVPTQSGIFFCGCPNCKGGSHGAGVMTWRLGMGDSVKCKYCGILFPNTQFPENQELVIRAPSGARQVYRWYKAPDGLEYHFQGRALYERYLWCEKMAYLLANIYALTGDAQCGDRAAVVLGRFAQVFPDYAVRYNYPFQPVKFFPADQKFPYEGVTEPYRGAKLNWWAYADIPERLARAYDLLRDGDSFERNANLLGQDIRARVEKDLLRLAYDFTNANPDLLTNMMPGTYRDMIVVGRILKDPAIVHDTIQRFQKFINSTFTMDGWWKELTPSYHWQVVNSLLGVVQAAQGYTDPPDWSCNRFDSLDLAITSDLLQKAIEVGSQAVLPDGRLIPINDTWAKDRREPLETSVSHLWQGMGHAVLADGDGDKQFQVHLNWSGAYGHSHADNGSILLWSFGKEMLSDIGYTHTKYRNWTINTASHNTVVVDCRSQLLGNPENPSTGNLLFYDDTDPQVKIIEADVSPAYPACSVYRRCLLSIQPAPGEHYVLDIFDVEGGQLHDYFLHGSADEEGVFESDFSSTEKVDSLVPDWGGQEEYIGENCLDLSGERFHPYMFLKNIVRSPLESSGTVSWRYEAVGLRIHVFPEPGMELYTFRSPSIRPAEEDNRLLDSAFRRGFLIRHRGPVSKFVLLLEPFQEMPWITSAKATTDGIVVQHKVSQETISWNNDRLVVESTAGWKYDSGVSKEFGFTAVSRQKPFALVAAEEAVSTNFVRVSFGKRSIGYRVRGSEGNKFLLEDDPGFEIDAASGSSRLAYFPFTEFHEMPRLIVRVK